MPTGTPGAKQGRRVLGRVVQTTLVLAMLVGLALLWWVLVAPALRTLQQADAQPPFSSAPAAGTSCASSSSISSRRT